MPKNIYEFSDFNKKKQDVCFWKGYPGKREIFFLLNAPLLWGFLISIRSLRPTSYAYSYSHLGPGRRRHWQRAGVTVRLEGWFKGRVMSSPGNHQDLSEKDTCGRPSWAAAYSDGKVDKPAVMCVIIELQGSILFHP